MKSHQTQAPLFNVRDLFGAQPVTAVIDENETISTLRRKNADLETDWRLMAQEVARKNDTLIRQEAEIARLEKMNRQLRDDQKNRNGGGSSSIPRDVWRRLIQLCHPDKHANANAATVATQWLNANKTA